MTERFTSLRVRLDHVGLACTSPHEVRSWTQTKDQLGREHSPVVAAPYGWAVTVRDQDNIPVEFFCTTPQGDRRVVALGQRGESTLLSLRRLPVPAPNDTLNIVSKASHNVR